MRHLALLLVGLAIPGCTHSRAVRGADDVAALNQHVEGRRVLVVLADGRRLRAEGVWVAGDSLSWIDPATRTVAVAAAADVRGVMVGGERGRGVFEGVYMGAGAGAVVGAGLGVATGHCLLDPACGRADAASLWARAVGFTGAGLGLFVGAVRGSPTVYRFREPLERRLPRHP